MKPFAAHLRVVGFGATEPTILTNRTALRPTVAELGLAGSSDPEILAQALAGGYTLVSENVADFTRISAEHLSSGHHHPGVLIALSSRLSRRPAGVSALVEAVRAVADQTLEDRVVYLDRERGSAMRCS